MRVAIFASGNGTNFEILAQQFQNHDLPGELVLLFCDHPTAHVIDRAKRLKVPYETFTVKECGGKPTYEKRILKVLQDYQIDFIALAGYMRVVGSTILDHFEGSIVNLHPAYLPAYPGLHSIERAFADHQTQTGVTIHYIDSGLDSGPIIAQEHVVIKPDDTIESLEERVHATEHRLYPVVLKEVLTKRIEKGE